MAAPFRIIVSLSFPRQTIVFIPFPKQLFFAGICPLGVLRDLTEWAVWNNRNESKGKRTQGTFGGKAAKK